MSVLEQLNERLGNLAAEARRSLVHQQRSWLATRQWLGHDLAQRWLDPDQCARDRARRLARGAL